MACRGGVSVVVSLSLPFYMCPSLPLLLSLYYLFFRIKKETILGKKGETIVKRKRETTAKTAKLAHQKTKSPRESTRKSLSK